MLDPKVYGLSSRTELKEIKKNHIAIVKMRKSRIIMKDGVKLLEDIKKIIAVNPKLSVSLLTNAPVCSKTSAFLGNHNIKIIHQD